MEEYLLKITKEERNYLLNVMNVNKYSCKRLQANKTLKLVENLIRKLERVVLEWKN